MKSTLVSRVLPIAAAWFLPGMSAVALAAFIPVARFSAPDPQPGDFFGTSVSISGDTAVVWAYHFLGEVTRDSVHVFVRHGGAWVHEQNLDISAIDPSSFLHASAVSISGNTIVVGVSSSDDVGPVPGSAHVFVRSNGSWVEQQTLTAPIPQANAQFGISVAIHDDTIVVGAIGEDDESFMGAAHVFVRSSDVWSHQQRLVAPDAAVGDDFGYSVAIQGETIVVGAPVTDSPVNDAGSAYVFVRNGSVWSPQQKLAASDAAEGDLFGFDVAISGNTAVIASYLDDDGGTDAGSAHVFVRTGNSWALEQKLTATEGPVTPFFGFSVAVSGDTTVIGNHGGIGDSGAAHVFSRDGGTWNFLQKLRAGEGTSAEYLFGYSVAIDGETVLVGAPFGRTGEADPQPGFAYLFESDTTPPVITSVTASPDLLSPLSRAMVPVTVAVAVTDDSGEPVTTRISTVTSNEPESGTSPCDLSPDSRITGDLTLDLRAESSPTGSGRVYTITVECQDGAGNLATDTAQVTVPKDTTPPVITRVSVSPSVLSPPYHQAVPVSVTLSVTDDSGCLVTSKIISITSNEAETGTGPCDCAPDWAVLGDLAAILRAERGNRGTGRIYTITVECRDQSGNAATATVEAKVPKKVKGLKKPKVPKWLR